MTNVFVFLYMLYVVLCFIYLFNINSYTRDQVLCEFLLGLVVIDNQFLKEILFAQVPNIPSILQIPDISPGIKYMLNDFIDRGRRQGSFGEVALYTVHGSWWGSWRLMFIHVYIYSSIYIYSRTRQFCNVRENFVVGPQGHLIRYSLYLYICHRV